MRNLLVAGTATGLFLALAGAAYAANPNVPSFSPYAIMAYDAAPAPQAMAPLGEHRAASIDTYGAAPVSAPNTNVPSFSPYAIVPQGH
jgi:hypothetical protein